MRLLGIDGCSTGWLIASTDALDEIAHFEVRSDLEPIMRLATAGNALVVIDIPIGLPDNGPRGCDTAARTYCYPRHNSVFSAPCRATLSGLTYAEACQLNFEARGKTITKQLFGILPKIIAVDHLMNPALQANVREAHPEVSFAAISGGGKGMAHYKKTPEGERERLNSLDKYFGHVDPGSILSQLGRFRSGVARDDVVDALACLATAHRIRASSHHVLPSGDVPRDSRGLKMEIVA
jgi:predicted RNase H-like nuclease